MATEQQQIATRFNGFIQSLNALDWRVGITTAIMQSDNYSNGTPIPGTNGNLIPFTGAAAGTLFLDKAADNTANATYFSNTVSRPVSCGGGMGGNNNCDFHERAI